MGLYVIQNSIQEYERVHRVQKGAKCISDVHRQAFCEQEARVFELLLQERFPENI